MLTPKQIEARKQKLRRSPDIKRLCERLGITVDRFLEDIEERALSCTLYEAPVDRAASKAKVASAFGRAFEALARDRQTKAGRLDRVASIKERSKETALCRIVGSEGY